MVEIIAWRHLTGAIRKFDISLKFGKVHARSLYNETLIDESITLLRACNPIQVRLIVLLHENTLIACRVT